MRDYIIRRVLGMIPLILIVMIVSFGIFSLVPNPFAALIENPRIKKADIQRLKHAWGFDLKWYLRFFKWFSGVIRGDWGPSLLYLSLIHISEPTRLGMISYAVFCLKKKKKK